MYYLYRRIQKNHPENFYIAEREREIGWLNEKLFIVGIINII